MKRRKRRSKKYDESIIDTIWLFINIFNAAKSGCPCFDVISHDLWEKRKSITVDAGSLQKFTFWRSTADTNFCYTHYKIKNKPRFVVAIKFHENNKTVHETF